MEFRSEFEDHKGSRIEKATVIHQGHEYTNLGSIVGPNLVVGYPRLVGGRGTLNTFSGDPLGPCRVVAMWRTPHGIMSSHQYQIEATVNGVVYTGRGGGDGLLYRGRRKRS